VNTFIRWGKFNLVGAMGMVVQLTALALLNRWAPGHYLYASAAAVELTLLHNFVWHLHYTWHDRRDDSALLTQFVRFHLSNGLVSLLGNLALMRYWCRKRTYLSSSRTVLRFFAARLSTSAWEMIGSSRQRRSQSEARRSCAD